MALRNGCVECVSATASVRDLGHSRTLFLLLTLRARDTSNPCTVEHFNLRIVTLIDGSAESERRDECVYVLSYTEGGY